MRRRLPPLVFAGIAATACSGRAQPDVRQGQPDVRQGQPDVPPETVEEPSNDASAVAGWWTSAACGERSYPRELTFDAAGHYSGRDLVSPCPDGATCIWSGIVEYSGSWALDGDTITLSEATAAQGPGAVGRPATLTLKKSALLDPDGCKYGRGGQ